MGEADAFFFSRDREQIKRSDCKGHTDPLIQIQPLTEDHQRAHQCQYRLRRLDWSGQGQRQMLQGKIAEDPRGKDYHGLDEYSDMGFKRHAGHIEQRAVQHICRIGKHNKGQEYQTAEQRIEKQYRNHCIPVERHLLIHLVTAQQKSRQKSIKNPHIS